MEKHRIGLFHCGMEAPDLVVELVKFHKEIEYIKLQEYQPHVLGITEELKQKPEVPVKNLIRHHPDAGEYSIRLKSTDVTVEKIISLIDKSAKREEGKRALVLCSRVETRDDEVLHIPMLDFECSVSPENLIKVSQFIEETNSRGLILESGRSYHFYGLDLLSPEKWAQFMFRAGLFTGFTDSRHIYHRLLSHEARLRLAKIEGSDRYLMTPRVVSIVQ